MVSAHPVGVIRCGGTQHRVHLRLPHMNSARVTTEEHVNTPEVLDCAHVLQDGLQAHSFTKLDMNDFSVECVPACL